MTQRKDTLRAVLEKDGIEGSDDIRLYEFARFNKWISQIDRAW
jgi:hypothetical protein